MKEGQANVAHLTNFSHMTTPWTLMLISDRIEKFSLTLSIHALKFLILLQTICLTSFLLRRSSISRRGRSQTGVL